MDLVIFKIVFLIHIAGAIIGFGPTFTFGILGPMAGRAGPNGKFFIEAMVAIEKRLVVPFVMIQPLSGTALIFLGGFAQDFLSHYWLLTAILLFVINVVISFRWQVPALHRMLELAQAGGPPTPEFLSLARRTQRLGPVLTVLLVAIIVLMATKPGP